MACASERFSLARAFSHAAASEQALFLVAAESE